MLNKTCDLHIHSHYSDSTLTPQDIVKSAKAQGISCVALSDHDTVEGVVPTIEAGKECGIEVLAAVELSSEINGRDVHVLGYLLDVNDSYFINKLSQMQNTRVERMQQMIDKCKAFGIDNIVLEEVAALAQTDSLGRPHLAQILVQKKWVPNIKSAFDKYLADDAPAYVPKFKQTPAEAIELIHAAGGVAVLAHPMVSGVDELIPSFVAAGLDGLEVIYPNVSQTVQDFYQGIANKHGMLITGGSDAHGETKKHIYIGKIQAPYEIVDALRIRKQANESNQ